MAQIDWELLDRYLGGECSPQERDRFERWLSTHPAHERIVRALRLAVEESDLAREGESRRAAAWARLQAAIEPPASAAPPALPPRRAPASLRQAAAFGAPPRLAARAIAARVAAGILIATGLAFGVRAAVTARAPGARPGEQVSVSTARGQRATFRLPDGSRVVLAPSSTLRYPASPAVARQVELEGEAYFDVVHDARRPFLVRAAGTLTEDLGTEFTVRAYAAEPGVRVVVAAGKVSLRLAAAPRAASRVLEPGDLARLTPDGAATVRRVDVTSYLSWTSGRLAFDDAPLVEVLSLLQQWYDADFSLADSTLGSRRFTGTFSEDHSLSEVLDALAPALDLSYERRGRAVVLLPLPDRP